MPNPARYKTWSRNRSVRLTGHDYRENLPYHVIIHARRGARPFDIQQLSEMVCRELTTMSNRLSIYLGAYCLMPDHMHILLSPAGSNLSLGEFVGRFKGRTTNESWRLGWKGRLWQARFYDHIVRRGESVAETARYIIENPQRAGDRCERALCWFDPVLL